MEPNKPCEKEGWTERIERYIREGRSVSGGKGGNSQQEMQQANQQQQLENQLAQSQLQMQQGQLNAVNNVVNPMIANGGLTPQMQAALQANVTNQLGGNFRQGVGGLNQLLTSRGLTGGMNAGGGGVGQGYGALFSNLAGLQQQGQFGIAGLQNQALMNELGLKLGIGSQFGGNVGTFNSGAQQSLGSAVNAAQNADQAQTSWMGPIFGALGSVGSQAIKTWG